MATYHLGTAFSEAARRLAIYGRTGRPASPRGLRLAHGVEILMSRAVVTMSCAAISASTNMFVWSDTAGNYRPREGHEFAAQRSAACRDRRPLRHLVWLAASHYQERRLRLQLARQGLASRNASSSGKRREHLDSFTADSTSPFQPFALRGFLQRPPRTPCRDSLPSIATAVGGNPEAIL